MNKQTISKNFKYFMLIYVVLGCLSFILSKENKCINGQIVNTFLIVGEFVAVTILYNTYVKSKGNEKRYWLYLFLSILSYFIGDCIWILKETFFNDKLVLVHIANVFYFMQYPFSITALLYIAWKKRDAYLSLQVFLDMLVTVIAISVVVWRFLVSPNFTRVGLTSLEKFFLLANPVGDLAILFSIIFILLFSQNVISLKVIFLNIIALIVEIIGDLTYLYVKIKYNTINTDFLDFMWLVAILLIAYSAIVYGTKDNKNKYLNKNKNYISGMNLAKMTVPYLSVGILFTIIFSMVESIDIIMVSFAVCVWLVIIRQFLMLLDNERLMNLLIKSNNELEYKSFQLEMINKQLEKSNILKEIQSNTDFLTGLYNRRYIYEKLNDLFKDKKFYSKISVLMIDIDHFKKINDTYGHKVGDEVLKQVSALMKLYSRKEDTLIRFGGEEFIYFLLDTDIVIGKIIAERIRRKVEKHNFIIGKINLKVTVSIGVSEVKRVKSKEDVELAIKKADKAVYEAKELGRNQVR